MKILTQGLIWCLVYKQSVYPQIAKFMGPTWAPSGSCRPQMGPMLAPWTLRFMHPSACHLIVCHCHLQENLAKKRSLTKQMKMPELAETSELEASKPLAKPEGATATNHVDLFDEDSVSARAFPNLPDETLERMGLLRRKGDPLNRYVTGTNLSLVLLMWQWHNMSVLSQITGNSTVCSTACSGL